MAEERDSKAQLSFRGHVHKFSVETKAVPTGFNRPLLGISAVTSGEAFPLEHISLSQKVNHVSVIMEREVLQEEVF